MKEKIIVKKTEKIVETKQRTSYMSNEGLNETQKYKIKDKKIEDIKKKPKRELLDNYRYIEIKCINEDNERRRSIVKHRRLSQPIGKETSYERERYGTSTNYSLKRPILSQIKEERKTYNQKEIRKITPINAKNSVQTDKNRTYQVKQSFQKSNISSNKNQQISSVNYRRSQNSKNIQEKRAINMNQQNLTLNQKQSNTNQGKTSINQKEREQITQNHVENSKNKNMIKDDYPNESPEKQIEKEIDQQNEIFNSPHQNKINEGEDDYRYQSQTESLEICKKCGKPKRPKGIYSGEKLGKSVKREIIAEEKSENNYIIRYGTENEYQKEPYFETFRAPGTHFCPVHGYV